MQKQDILNNLYTLRAGLSVISQECAKIEANNKSTQNAITAEAQKLRNYLPYDVKEDERYNFENFFTNETYDLIESKYQSSKSRKNSQVAVLFFNLIIACVIVAIEIFLGFKLYEHILIFNEDGYTADTWFLLVYGGIIVLIFAIWLTWQIKGNSTIVHSISLMRHFGRRKRCFGKICKLYPRTIKAVERLKRENDTRNQPIIQRCNLLYGALVKQFSYILSERDWNLLEYVIYSIETRRADDIKEALRYADDEIRTNRIIQAQQQATAMVSRAISSGINEIRIAINQGCKEIADANRKIAGEIGGLTESVNMSNALLKERNKLTASILKEFKELCKKY